MDQGTVHINYIYKHIPNMVLKRIIMNGFVPSASYKTSAIVFDLVRINHNCTGTCEVLRAACLIEGTLPNSSYYDPNRGYNNKKTAQGKPKANRRHGYFVCST